jgi:hypothetical protein
MTGKLERYNKPQWQTERVLEDIKELNKMIKEALEEPDHNVQPYMGE